MKISKTFNQSFVSILLFTLIGSFPLMAANEKHITHKKFKPPKYITKTLKNSGFEKKSLNKALEFSIPKKMGNKLNAIQWYFKAGSKGRPILSGNRYQLVNMVSEKSITHIKRARGVNIGEEKVSSNNYNMMVRGKKRNGVLRYGDVVALHLKPYGWIRYKKQGKYGGINLGDDDHKPHYIWKISGGKTGTKLLSGMPFALYNLKPVKTEMTSCVRLVGPNFGWRGKSKCGGTAANLSNTIFGANGALSGDGLSGKIAKKWKHNLCKTAVASASAYAVSQSGGTAALAVKEAAPIAIKKCNKL